VAQLASAHGWGP